MKRQISILSAAGLLFAAPAIGQQVYAYPQKGQSESQQTKDKAECSTWAQQQSGVNPNAQAQQQGHLKGTVGGAARGAAMGAAVGAIAGDAGKGAAIGSVAGAARGRRGSKVKQEVEKAESNDSYQRAFAACMESRGYTVK